MIVEVYSDFVCPWCYIGLRRLERVQAALPSASRPEVIWRSFQLDSDAARVPSQTAAEAMRGWYATAAEADDRIARIQSMGRDEGLHLNLERAKLVNSFDAHRLAQLATRAGLGSQVRERIFRAYHTEGLNIADPDVLVGIAGSTGLDQTKARALLDSDQCARDVLADRAKAFRLGVSGVPSLAIGGAPPFSAILDDAVLYRKLRMTEARHDR